MTMKKMLLFVLLPLVSVTASAQKLDTRLVGIDTMILRILQEWNAPGVTISIVEKNNIVLTKGFGYRDLDTRKPVTENTLFAIGSCTKAFTAALLSEELKAGKIDLDAPVINYWPEFRLYNTELTANVTLRDMLCHRTGVPRHDFSWYSGAAVSRDSLVRLLRFHEPSAPIRQTFQYNNLMYVAIAHLLEKTNNASWEDLIKSRIFTPLGMNNSTTGSVPENKDYAVGYINRNGETRKLDFLTDKLKGIAPAGGIVSNAKDMANWLLMWTNQGSFNGKEVISSDFSSQAISSQMIAKPNLPTKYLPDYYFFNYGFGWYTANYRGHYGLGHGGNINGFSSFVSLMPADSIAVFVSVNQNNSQVPRILTNLLVDRMIDAKFRDWNAMIKSTVNNPTTEKVGPAETSKPSHSLSDFAGTYTNSGYGTITVNEQAGVLQGTFNRWKLRIQHLHHNYFKIYSDHDAFDESQALTGEFSVTADGTIGSLKIPFEDNIKEIEFAKQVTAQTNKVNASDYVGEYEIGGVTATIQLTESGILKAVIPGQPAYEMINVKPDEFSLKGVKGVKINFQRNTNGEVSSSIFTQPNGTFTAIKKSKGGNKPSNDTKKADVPNQTNTNQFAKFIGEYNLGGQTVKIFTTNNDLMALLPGQPAYTLIPSTENEFTVKGVKGYRVQFDSDKDGKVIGFTMIQPNGKMKASKNN